MTDDALAGRPTAYYPEGRAAQRPGTLQPASDEAVAAVVDDLEDAGSVLLARWSALDEAAWTTVVREPADNPDLGPLTVEHLAVLRLTEVEVHATDLDIGLPDWSDVLVELAVPRRLARGAVLPPWASSLSRRDQLALLLGRPLVGPHDPALLAAHRVAQPGP